LTQPSAGLGRVGPAVVATIQDRGSKHFQDFWVFVVGPILGALLAVVNFKFMKLRVPEDANDEAKSMELPGRAEEA